MAITFSDFVNNLISSPILFVISILISAVMFINGCSDVPNAIATCVSTRSLSPKKALVLAVIFNSLGVFVVTLITSKVAETVFNIVNFESNGLRSIIALCSALIGIVLWCTISWIFGIPSSQSHALIAGISGSAIALQGNLSGINFEEWKKVLYGLFIVNILAFFIGYATTRIVEKICMNMDRRKTNRFFKKMQICGAVSMCFMNGAQDGQKFMAILLLGVVLTNGNAQLLSDFSIPIWLMIYCSLLISIGAIIGGIRIIKMIGTKVSKVERYQGTSADISSTLCLIASSILGIPVSSTHTKNCAVMGVGASKRLSNVNWRVTKNIVLTWLLTFPGCGLLGYILTKFSIYLFL